MTVTTIPPVPTACSATVGVLSEGPRWDGERGELLRVDIIGARMHRTRVRADGLLDELGAVEFDRPAGAVAAAVGGGHVVAATSALCSWTGCAASSSLPNPSRAGASSASTAAA